MKKIISITLLLCVLCACTARVPGVNESFTWHLPQTVVSVDPQTVQTATQKAVVSLLFEGLTRMDGTGAILPGVAESWQVSEDGTVYTFTLRKNAVWSNGEPVTATDFLFAIQRALRPETGSKQATELFILRGAQKYYEGQGTFAEVGIRVPDKMTLQCTLCHADETFLQLTASPVFMPCHAECFSASTGRYGMTYQNVLTNGPFQFVNRYSWEENVSLALERNADYVGEVPVYPAFLTLTMGGTEEGLSLLQQEKTDAAQIPFSRQEEARRLGCTVQTVADRVWGFALNTEDGQLQEEALRVRLLSVLSRTALQQALPADCLPQNDLIPAGKLCRQEDYRQKVPSAALSENSGTADGMVLTGLTVLCPDTPTAKTLVSAAITAWNDAFGIYCNMEPVGEKELQNRLAAGEYQIALCTVEPGERFAKNYLQLFASGATPCLYADPSFDAALQTAATPTALYALERQLLQKGVFYPVYAQKSCYAFAPGVSDVVVYAQDYLDWSGARREKK